MPGVFLSYRREDSSGQAGRLFDILAAHFGRDRVFMDLDTIRGGDNFVTVIEQQVARCDVLLAIIGERWLAAGTPNGLRRLDDPADFVRLEIAKALERDVRVIPVLVGNATVPREQDLPPDLRPLALRHALDLRDAHFHEDAQKLIEVIAATVPDTPPPRSRRRLAGFTAPAALLLVAILLGGGLFLRHKSLGYSSPKAAIPRQAEPDSASAARTPGIVAPSPSAAASLASPLTRLNSALKPRAARMPESSSSAPFAGDWKGTVKYDWPNAVYKETFHFEVEGADVTGTAAMLEDPRAIREGRVDGNRISFKTVTATELDNTIYHDQHTYKGILNGNAIDFTLLIDTEYEGHVPIHFTVTRLPATK